MIIPLIALITGFLVGHYTPVPVTSYKLSELEQCVQQQVDQYFDICAEESSGYENMSGSEAHFTGVQCAVESIKICMESN